MTTESPALSAGPVADSSTTSTPFNSSSISSKQEQAPVPDRATKPAVIPRTSDRPGYPTSGSETRISSQMTPSPSLRLAFDDPQKQSRADEYHIGGRISPFSTPPRSDFNLEANSGYQLSPCRVSHTSAQASKVVLPSQAEYGTAGRIGQIGPQHSSAIVSLSNPRPDASRRTTTGQRPALPPRPISTPRSPAVLLQHTRSSSPIRASNSSERALESHQPTSNLPVAEQQTYPSSTKASRRSPSLAPPRQVSKRVLASTYTANRPLSASSLKTDPAHLESNQALAVASYSPDISVPKNGLSTAEPPDGSCSNRRPPYAQIGRQTIPANYDSKLFDICNGNVCSAGQLVRVWEILSGKLVLSLALGEREVKATAIAFKPGPNTDEEGSCLWVGTNYGDLYEIDIRIHEVVSRRLNIHSGREIVRIHRYQNLMWTLDEDGSLYIWPPSDDGLPSLQSKPVSRKLPRGYTFSIVIEGVLWVAFGKELQIFRPLIDEVGDFKPTQQPHSGKDVGEIISGAVVGQNLDKVYFSHSDGKISSYSVADHTSLDMVNASVYKINCLVGAGAYLWAGYNTGKISVYDTQSQPWKVVKEWSAHDGPVTGLSVDQTGFWMSGSLRVGSISLDNTIKLWDGLLEEDWLGTFSSQCDKNKGWLTRYTESEMQRNDASWCNFREIEAVVMTWNAGASTPASLRYDEQESNMLRLLLPPGKAPDLLIFGFQELVDLEDKRLTASQ
ncbi:MAG: hypothetical protein Q9170_003219 [Blastenia crenularia]